MRMFKFIVPDHAPYEGVFESIDKAEAFGKKVGAEEVIVKQKYQLPKEEQI